MFHGWYGNGWAPGGAYLGFPWGGLIMGIVLLALAVFAVVALVRMGKNRYPVARGSGLQILEERFARGEIDAETFRAMKSELEK